jgi:hypothetical protein
MKTHSEQQSITNSINGRSGGLAVSKRKRKAARANGKLGGRPRKTDRCPCGDLPRERAEKRGHRCG